MKTFLIQPNDSDQRLDRFLKKMLPSLPNSLLYKAIRKKQIKVNRKRCTGETRLQTGDENAIYLPVQGLPCGMPFRAFCTFSFKVSDEQVLIDKIAGIKAEFNVEDIMDRVMSMLDMLMMKWISKEGKDMFNIQANAVEISEGIKGELNTELEKIGLAATGFQIDSVSYPEEVQEMVTKVAGQSMVGDMGRYQQMAMIDAMTNTSNNGGGNNMAADMASMQMGMMMGQQMVNQMQNAMQGQNNQNIAQGQVQNTASNVQLQSQPQPQAEQPAGGVPNFCPNCGQKTEGSKFCPNCGQKLVP